MKRKVIVFMAACSIGISSSLACDNDECGGGKDKCCTDRLGHTYHCKARNTQLD